MKNLTNKKHNILKIKDLCEIFMGQSLREKAISEVEGIYPIFQPKNLTKMGLDYSKLEKINLPEKSEPKVLQNQDVLIYTKLSRNELPTTVLIEDPIQNLIAAPSFFILRVKKDEIKPAFLNWFLSSKNHGGKYFLANATGTSILNITRKVIEDLEIFVPSVSEQEKFIEFHKNTLKEQEIFNQITFQRELLLESLYKKWSDHE